MMLKRLAFAAALALAACGNTSTSPARVPVIRAFTVTPASVAPGGEVQLAWDVSSDAVSLFIDQGVGTVTGTSVAVHPAETTTYTLTATGASGGAATATATVTTSTVAAPIISQFTASPPSIGTGGAATLSWSVTNADTLSIDHGIGTVTGTARAVTPAQTTTYTLTASGAGGTRTATATLTVLPAPALTFSASPATIAAGASSTLSWTAAFATSLSIDQGVGAVTSLTSVAVSPAVTTVYQLTATGAGGVATLSTTVTVTGTTPSPPTIASFTATPSTISAGAASTLQWSVSNATSLSIDQGIGAVTGQSASVTPAATTIYTLTANGPGGSATATATVTVSATSAPLIQSFAASPASITSGGSATLSWSVSNATSLSIDNGVGAVTGTSKAVTPAATTIYTLTASGGGGAATARATVTVSAATGPSLVYTDPAAGTGKLRLVRNAASTARHLVLDLQVGSAPLNLFGVALTLPLNAALVSFASSGSTSLGGLSVSGPINPGAAPPAAAARLVTSGPLAGRLVIGVARKKTAAADGDVTCAAGATLFSIALDGAGTGTGTVFDGGAPGPGFRGRGLSKSGLLIVSEADVAIGALAAQ